MNKKDVLRYLVLYLGDSLYCAEILTELFDILQGSGVEAAFFKQLVKLLRILADRGGNATEMPGFEPLDSGIYSMRFEGRDYNIRILYAFMPDRRPVLLHAFYERAGKKATDYTGKISLALTRLRTKKEK